MAFTFLGVWEVRARKIQRAIACLSAAMNVDKDFELFMKGPSCILMDELRMAGVADDAIRAYEEHVERWREAIRSLAAER